MNRRWHQFNSINALVIDCAEAVGKIANAVIAMGRPFQIVISGGRTPVVLFQRLVKLDTDWRQWHIYFADERCLPLGHIDRNDTQARAQWLHHVDIPEANIHAIPAERGSQAAATAYAETLKNVGMFDLTMLGIGEDGHTASLFPGHPALRETAAATVAVNNSPKPPPERVSLTVTRLSRSNRVWFIATGTDKVSALTALKQGQIIPAAQITAARGIDIFTDCTLPE